MEPRLTMKTCSLGLILTVLVTVAACGPPLEAKAPISAEATAPVDERLIGAWYVDLDRKGPEGNLPNLLIDRGYEDSIAGNKQPTWLHVNFIEMEPYKIHSYHMRAHPSDVDGVTYYNLRRTPDLPNLDYSAPDEAPGFMIMRVFFITDDLIFVCTLGWHDDGPLSSVVEKLQSFGAEARVVQGVPRFGEQIYVEKDKYLQPIHGSRFEYVVLDVTSEQLVDLIRNSPPNELFHVWAAFARFGSEVEKGSLEELEPNLKLEIQEACGSH